MVADSTESYLGFETDLQDLELGYLLQRADRRLEVVLVDLTKTGQKLKIKLRFSAVVWGES